MIDLNILNYVCSTKYKLKDFSEKFKKILQSKTCVSACDGKYLIQNGMQEGGKIGRVLKTIEKEWMNNNFQISKDRVREIIKYNTN